KTQRNFFLDGNIVSAVQVKGEKPWVQVRMLGGEPPQLDRVDVGLRKILAPVPSDGWSIVVSGSDDGATWTEAGRFTGHEFPGQHDSEPGFVQSVPFSASARYRIYRVAFDAATVKTWGVGDLQFSFQGK